MGASAPALAAPFGRRLEDKYEIMHEIGSGTTGRIYLARYRRAQVHVPAGPEPPTGAHGVGAAARPRQAPSWLDGSLLCGTCGACGCCDRGAEWDREGPPAPASPPAGSLSARGSPPRPAPARGNRPRRLRRAGAARLGRQSEAARMFRGHAPSALGVRTLCCLLVLRTGAAYLAYSGSFRCSVPDSYSDAELQDVFSRNCHFVNAWKLEVEEAIGEGLHEIVGRSQDQQADWRARGGNASNACSFAALSAQAGQYVHAANLSVNAWGSIVRQGATCCTLLHPPYCVDQDWSASTVALLVPAAMLVALLAAAALVSCRGVPPKGRAGLSPGEAKSERRDVPSAVDRGAAA